MPIMSQTPVMALVVCSVFHAGADTPRHDYPITPISFTDVVFTDTFWRPRLITNQTITLPANFVKSEETGRISNFAKAGGLMEGKHEGIFFNDSDVFKIVEGAAYTLASMQDNELDAYLDKLIRLFAAAQEQDGYLYTARTIDPENAPAVIGKARWENIQIAHELYNVGHMYEAAAAHYLATGKRTLLDVALKNAALITQEFGPGKRYAAPGHQEIEMGLVKLYRITGDMSLLDTARFFIEQRGNSKNRRLFGEYCQDHKPLLEQEEAVGHAVRAGYFYAGAADVAALTGNQAYTQALDRIWQNVVFRKLYITGGIGARHQGEQFGDNYELPNDTAYAETCAAIANILWNHRMFLLTGEGRFMDVLERSLYNGFLAGVSISGDTFFYVNPLASNGEHKFNHGAATRQPWFDCSCCPTNIVRFLPSLPGYVYAIRDNNIYINLYVEGKANLHLGDASFQIEQHTRYPWDGRIQLTIQTDSPVEAPLRLRIPAWAQGAPCPGDLYHYLDDDVLPISITVNGEAATMKMDKGYAVLERQWRGGEVVVLDLPMPVKKVKSHDNVVSNHGRIAIERGPLVYCAEGIDNNGQVTNLHISEDVIFALDKITILDTTVTAITGALPSDSHNAVKGSSNGQQESFTLIPYFAWSHRGVGEMQVWLHAADKTD